jgi:hypothetical protein
MRKSFIEALAVALCCFQWAAPMVAATPTPQKTVNKTMKQTDVMRSTWPLETLSGSIIMVDPAHKLLVVEGSDGVPFDMVVTGSTLIESGRHRLMLDQLSTDQGRNVSVRFAPERSGDIARTIRIGG